MSDGVINGKTYPYPHCNAEVLHAPGRCVYCDAFPERQRMREAGGGGFTPDEANGWSGNTAAPAGQEHTHMGVSYIPEGLIGPMVTQGTDVRCEATDLGYRCEGRVINGREHFGYHHFGARSWPKDNGGWPRMDRDGDRARPCELPPKGWWCSLGAGHDGPCPAHPTMWTKLGQAVQRALLRR